MESLFETKSVVELDAMLKSETCPPEHKEAIVSLLDKAHAAAQVFDTHISEVFMKNYLNDVLGIDSLCFLRSTVAFGSDTYSRSHLGWLQELSSAKLRWDWDKTKHLDTLIALDKSFGAVQRATYAAQKTVKAFKAFKALL
jgi:hypothetical protein